MITKYVNFYPTYNDANRYDGWHLTKDKDVYLKSSLTTVIGDETRAKALMGALLTDGVSVRNILGIKVGTTGVMRLDLSDAISAECGIDVVYVDTTGLKDDEKNIECLVKFLIVASTKADWNSKLQKLYQDSTFKKWNQCLGGKEIAIATTGTANALPGGTFSPYVGDTGCDIHAARGSPVYAMMGGTIEYAECCKAKTMYDASQISGASDCECTQGSRAHTKWDCVKGDDDCAVGITQTDGRSAYYLHMSKAETLSVGQSVTAGQKVGEVGIANNVAHLHLEFGDQQDPFEACKIVKAAAGSTT